MVSLELAQAHLLQGFGRDAEDFNLLFYAIKAKNRNAIVIVMEKMLALHGPTSFHWANSKGGFSCKQVS